MLKTKSVITSCQSIGRLQHPIFCQFGRNYHHNGGIRNNNIFSKNMENRRSLISPLFTNHIFQNNNSDINVRQRNFCSQLLNIEAMDSKVPLSFKFGCYFLGIITLSGSVYYLRENLLFGTVAGFAAKSLTAPLERITVYKQASMELKEDIKSSSEKMTNNNKLHHKHKYSNPNAGSIIKSILHKEGIFGLWRGNAINIARASIQKGALFALNDFFKKLFSKLSFFKKKNSNNNNDIASKKHGTILSFISGVCAGLASTAYTYPMEVVKTVNQTMINKTKWPMITVWYYLATTRGYFRGPWTAVVPTLIGTSMYYGVKFTAFDTFMKMGKKWNKNHGYEDDDDNGQTLENNNDEMDNNNNNDTSSFDSNSMNEKDKNSNNNSKNSGFIISQGVLQAVGGGIAGISGNCITFPNNCIRKRMQTTHVMKAMNVESKYEAMNWRNTAITMYHNEGGIRRFYNGFGINLVRNAPNTAIQFYVYKQLQIHYDAMFPKAK